MTRNPTNRTLFGDGDERAVQKHDVLMCIGVLFFRLLFLADLTECKDLRSTLFDLAIAGALAVAAVFYIKLAAMLLPDRPLLLLAALNPFLSAANAPIFAVQILCTFGIVCAALRRAQNRLTKYLIFLLSVVVGFGCYYVHFTLIGFLAAVLFALDEANSTRQSRFGVFSVCGSVIGCIAAALLHEKLFARFPVLETVVFLPIHNVLRRNLKVALVSAAVILAVFILVNRLTRSAAYAQYERTLAAQTVQSETQTAVFTLPILLAVGITALGVALRLPDAATFAVMIPLYAAAVLASGGNHAAQRFVGAATYCYTKRFPACMLFLAIYGVSAFALYESNFLFSGIQNYLG